MRIPLFLFGYVQVSVDSFSNLSLLTLITQNKKTLYLYAWQSGLPYYHSIHFTRKHPKTSLC